MTPNMIGAYGEWAAQTMQDPPRLSFRQPMFGNVEAWRAVARARYREMLMGPGAKKVLHADWNECYVIQATTPEGDTARPSPEHAFVALRVYTRERWEQDKNPHGGSDQAINGIGDEAIDQGSAIAFRKGDNCFMLSGWRSYLDSAEHPIADLPNKILSRVP